LSVFRHWRPAPSQAGVISLRTSRRPTSSPRQSRTKSSSGVRIPRYGSGRRPTSRRLPMPLMLVERASNEHKAPVRHGWCRSGVVQGSTRTRCRLRRSKQAVAVPAHPRRTPSDGSSPRKGHSSPPCCTRWDSADWYRAERNSCTCCPCPYPRWTSPPFSSGPSRGGRRSARTGRSCSMTARTCPAVRCSAWAASGAACAPRRPRGSYSWPRAPGASGPPATGLTGRPRCSAPPERVGALSKASRCWRPTLVRRTGRCGRPPPRRPRAGLLDEAVLLCRLSDRVPAVQPLILDANVANALRASTGDPWRRGSWPSSQYLEYCTLARRWADEEGVEPHDIEYRLFVAGRGT
jgi:hypothetical protein